MQVSYESLRALPVVVELYIILQMRYIIQLISLYQTTYVLAVLFLGHKRIIFHILDILQTVGQCSAVQCTQSVSLCICRTVQWKLWGKSELEVVVEVYDCARKFTADVHHYGSHLHSYFLMTNPVLILTYFLVSICEQGI